MSFVKPYAGVTQLQRLKNKLSTLGGQTTTPSSCPLALSREFIDWLASKTTEPVYNKNKYPTPEDIAYFTGQFDFIQQLYIEWGRQNESIQS